MSSEHSSTRAGTLWQDRAFLLFWSGRTVTLLGSAITKVVLPILVYRLTGSALLTSLTAQSANRFDGNDHASSSCT